MMGPIVDDFCPVAKLDFRIIANRRAGKGLRLRAKDAANHQTSVIRDRYIIRDRDKGFPVTGNKRRVRIRKIGTVRRTRGIFISLARVRQNQAIARCDRAIALDRGVGPGDDIDGLAATGVLRDFQSFLDGRVIDVRAARDVAHGLTEGDGPVIRIRGTVLAGLESRVSDADRKEAEDGGQEKG